MTTRFPERLKTVPDIPKEFGDDGGHFYRYYDELADEIDEDLVKSLKAQLDGILIFAGLFAGVNSAFLALTLPQMSADPADDTNALLLQIALGGNTNITSAADLPSASFTPPPGIYPINVLFSVSLTLALLSSFMAVLGQQWIVHYRKRSGGGPEHQRWEQFRRYLGAKRWRLELVLDDLVPGMLQLGLGIFCIAFALYLGILSQSLNRIVVWLLYAAAATIFAMSTFVAFDPWCPFKLPWSRIVRPMVSGAATAVVWLGMCIVGVVPLFILNIIGCFWQAIAHFHRPSVQWEISATENLRKTVALCIKALPTLYQGFVSTGIRSPDDPDDLKIKALRRMMCTSKDRSALVYAAINLQVIRDKGALASLVNDEEFYTRLSGLHQATLRETQQGRTHSHRSFTESRVFSTSFFHLLITTGAVLHITWIDEDIYGEYGAAIIALDRLSISPHQMDALNQGAVTPFTVSCDKCSHCASLLFCMKVVDLAIKGYKYTTPTTFESAFKGIEEVLASADDWRLGCLVASVTVYSKEWYDSGQLSMFKAWPGSKLLEELFNSYRSTSESGMFRTMSRALTTLSAHWEGKPHHEIYVRLFELCLLPGRKEVSPDDQHAILERIDVHLLSAESWIRDERTSEINRQHGRDYQIRYVRSVAEFFRAYKDSFQYMWDVIGAPLGRYLEFVAGLMEADREHPENPGTMVIIRQIKSSFQTPRPFETWSYVTFRMETRDPQRPAYSKFCQRLSRVESIWERKISQDLGLRYQRLSCIQQRRERWCNQEGAAIHILAF